MSRELNAPARLRVWREDGKERFLRFDGGGPFTVVLGRRTCRGLRLAGLRPDRIPFDAWIGADFLSRPDRALS